MEKKTFAVTPLAADFCLFLAAELGPDYRTSDSPRGEKSKIRGSYTTYCYGTIDSTANGSCAKKPFIYKSKGFAKIVDE